MRPEVLRLVIQLAQSSHAPVDPVALRLVGGQLHPHDEVGGVAGGGEGAAPGACLVDGGVVGGGGLEIGLAARHEPDDGDGVEEHLWHGLGQHHGLPVPSAALKEQTLCRDIKLPPHNSEVNLLFYSL